MKNDVKISVVTVCYNAVDTIEKTILSVINQTYQDVEYIIIDGASKDGTVDLINNYRDKVSHFVSEPDKGIYDAMNKGINVATGDWINFMNAGDTFYDSEVISEVVKELDKDVDVVFGDVAYKIEGVLYRERAKPFYENLPLHHSMGFNHQSTFVKTEVARRLKFDLKYKLASDYNMIISIYRNNGFFQQLKNTIVALYDVDGISAKNCRLHMYETMMVDNPSVFCNFVRSYLIFLKNQLKRPIKPLIKILYPNYILKRRLTYYERL